MAGVKGQGRKFDVNEALDQATALFWKHGYDGTSIADLTSAMCITAPSLYAAFGGKRDLFYAVVDRYTQTDGDFMEKAFAADLEAADLVHRLLRDAAVYYSRSTTPGGCLIISAANCVAAENQQVADYTSKLRESNIERLENSIQADVDNGRLPREVDASEIACFIGTVIQGMAQRGRDGARTEELIKTAELAILTTTHLIDGHFT